MNEPTDYLQLVERVRAWADRKKLTLDDDLLEEMVRLRETHDGLAPGVWPAGSVEHLLLVRWPGHGSREPDPEAMGTTLETLWRYLRGHGQMAFESAPPKRLALEFRRAVPRMGERYDDPQAQGINRQLLAFGKELGLDATSAGSAEELQQMLDRIVTAWNAQSIDERLERSPRGSGPAPFGAEQLLLSAAGQEVQRDERIMMSDPAASAPYARSAPFLRRALELARWIGEGKETTAKEVLRPQVARAAYRELGLVGTCRGVWGMPAAERAAAMADPARRAEIEGEQLDERWRRSAMDIPELDQLWLAAMAGRLVEVRGRKAVGLPELPQDAEELVPLVLHMAATVLIQQRPRWDLPEIIFVLLPLAMDDAEWTTREELADAWWTNPRNTIFGEASAYPNREQSDEGIRWAVAFLIDLGAIVEDRERLVPTPLGHDLALVMVKMLETGDLET
ncbi:hypothetical protein [Ornithinimicrobium panacihumi]|uniref:hypothetical protein n=1 Tax=Ornithinimicrobium panacihumi TaxID=2008449 RepID=UPI003F8AEC41